MKWDAHTKSVCDCFWAGLAAFSTEHHFKWKKDWQTNYGYAVLSISQTFIFPKWTKRAVTSSKTNDSFVANGKTGAFKQKFEFWKACICHHAHDSFPIPKGLFRWN